MAASPQGQPTSTDAPCHYTPAPERLRLRNSCHGCASSKLKCSQEKPTCSRCAKRGLTCEYLAAKPGGRKPSRLSIGSQNRSNQPRAAYACLQAQVEPAAPSSSNSDASSATTISTSSSVIHNLFASLDETSSFASSVTQVDFGDCFPTPISDRTDMDLFGTIDHFSISINGSSTGSDELFDTFPLFGDTISELFSVSIPSPMPETLVQFGTELTQNNHAFGPENSPHSCLNQSLRFLDQISSLTYHKEAAASTTARTVVTEIKVAIDAISTMLTCTCLQDGYLLVIISFVVFKVLDLYAAVARHAPSPQHHRGPELSSPPVSDHVLSNTATIGNYCLDGADSARMAAQLVLNELHLVRRVVEKLSSALKKQVATGEGQVEANMRGTLGLTMLNERVLPFSPATYDNLALDLVNRCRALSLGIINQLREL